jgi:NADPH-dependent 2,4-dienoyl-CoA reductase/sulfur reductase-like enzyme
MTWAADVCVVGAGPAGLAAAVRAGEAGASVALLDSGAAMGGQYWRHPASARGGLDHDLHHDVAVYADLYRRATALIQQGTLAYRPGQHVWTLSAGQDGCLVRALGDGPAAAETVVSVRLTVLATGAMDRPLPFPGWDLPGVLTVGGLQALLKGHGVLAGQRVLLAGTGPLLLSAAAGVLARGGTVVGVLESARQRRWARHLTALAGVPGKLAEGARYAAVLARHGVTVRTGVMVTAAHGDDRVRSVTSARAGRDGMSQRRHEVDVLAVGWGFTPRLELHAAAGCALAAGEHGAVSVTVDDDQFTSCPAVLSAGEPTGIGGASLAVAEGQIAGIAAARRLGRGAGPGERELASLKRSRGRLRAFAAALASVYPDPGGWAARLTDDTVICRCEEVSYAEVRQALELGAGDVRTVKLLSRAGMGWCQGRICGYVVGCLAGGGTADPAAALRMPIAAPMPLGLLADAELAEDAELPADAELAEDAELPAHAELAEDAELPADAELAEDGELPADAGP